MAPRNLARIGLLLVLVAPYLAAPVAQDGLRFSPVPTPKPGLSNSTSSLVDVVVDGVSPASRSQQHSGSNQEVVQPDHQSLPLEYRQADDDPISERVDVRWHRDATEIHAPKYSWSTKVAIPGDECSHHLSGRSVEISRLVKHIHGRNMGQPNTTHPDRHILPPTFNTGPKLEAEALYKQSTSASPPVSGLEVLYPAPRVYRREAHFGKQRWGKENSNWDDSWKQKQGGDRDFHRFSAGTPPEGPPSWEDSDTNASKPPEVSSIAFLSRPPAASSIRSAVTPPGQTSAAQSSAPLRASSALSRGTPPGASNIVLSSLVLTTTTSSIPVATPQDYVLLVPAPAIYRQGRRAEKQDDYVKLFPSTHSKNAYSMRAKNEENDGSFHRNDLQDEDGIDLRSCSADDGREAYMACNKKLLNKSTVNTYLEAHSLHNVPDVHRRASNSTTLDGTDDTNVSDCELKPLLECEYVRLTGGTQIPECVWIRERCSRRDPFTPLYKDHSPYHVKHAHPRSPNADGSNYGLQQNEPTTTSQTETLTRLHRSAKSLVRRAPSNSTGGFNSNFTSNTSVFSNSTLLSNHTLVINSTRPSDVLGEPTKIRIQATVIPYSPYSHQMAPDVYNDPEAAKLAPSGPVEGEFGHEWGQGHFKRKRDDQLTKRHHNKPKKEENDDTKYLNATDRFTTVLQATNQEVHRRHTDAAPKQRGDDADEAFDPKKAGSNKQQYNDDHKPTALVSDTEVGDYDARPTRMMRRGARVDVGK